VHWDERERLEDEQVERASEGVGLRAQGYRSISRGRFL